MAEASTTPAGPSTASRAGQVAQPAYNVTTSLNSRVTESASRSIFAMMTAASGMALVGFEIKAKANLNASAAGGTRILFGFGFATVGLIAISHAGDSGAKFATGTALLVLVASFLANGTSFAKAASGLVSATTQNSFSPTTPKATTPTTPTAATTATTKPTTATAA